MSTGSFIGRPTDAAGGSQLTFETSPFLEGPNANWRECFPEIIGRSPALMELLKVIAKIARSDSSVLIYGESGTGKELIASAIHRLSPRSAKRFIPLNCSAITETLLESELFGHEKGAFTGAVSRRAGHFEIANGGTILLDEIGDMHQSLQVKILRVLQEKQYTPVGSSELKSTDVRIIAATNVDLEKAVKENRFRLDLFYRLNVLPVYVPPLRERAGDVALLLEHFLSYGNVKHGVANPCFFEPEVLEILTRYPWPGNVRELQNLVERLVVITGGGAVRLKDLPQEYVQAASQSSASPAPRPLVETAAVHQERLMAPMRPGNAKVHYPAEFGTLPDEGLNLVELIEGLENSLIMQALDRTNHNKNQAAKLLGLNRTTLVERIKKRKLAPLNSPSKEL